jgi:GR25 family glycosyltransferase involved in LPS biosynthesis
MKHFVINLERREDRRNKFIANNRGKFDFEFVKAVDGSTLTPETLALKGMKANENWTDQSGRSISDGEVGCFLSHYGLWQKCIALNEPICIIEDDIIVNLEDYKKALKYPGFDFIYIACNDIREQNQKIVNDDLFMPGYAWNLSAYIITPSAAKHLVNTDILKNIIPADEYAPRMHEKNLYRTVAIRNPQTQAIYTNSDVTFKLALNATDCAAKEFYSVDWHVLTMGTDETKMHRIAKSAYDNEIQYKNLGAGVTWKGGTMEFKGGGHKINAVKEYIKDKRDSDYVLFVDAYDVFFTSDLETIIERFWEFECEAIFGAEKTCWPNENLANQFDQTQDYPYLNSGTYIAKVGKLKRLLSDPIEDYEDDQEYLQKQYLNSEGVKLDHEQYIFMTSDLENLQIKNGDSFNSLTRCYGCIVHGNGGELEKKAFDRLFLQMNKTETSPLYIPNYGKYEKISEDMLVVDFMTKDQCDRLIELSNEHGGWEPMPGDKFPAYEIRMKEMGLWEDLEKYWIEHIYPVVEEYWSPLQMYGLRDAFTMRYTMDTQTSLRNHHDASLVTGSVKLNDDYEGAELIFPRQGITNNAIDVGKCILFPGQVTHGHYCDELKSGTKYSLTMWTSRYKGDVN